MASLTEIRKALVHTIKTYSAIDVAAYATPPDVIETPAVVAEPASADFTMAMAMGEDSWDFYIYVLVDRGDEAESQALLDQFVAGSGPSSIRQILFDHSDLGLDGTDCIVTGMHGYGGNHEAAKIPHIGAVLKVHVETSP